MSAVSYSAPCDRCGQPATWLGDPDGVYPGGTVYEVACPACDDAAEAKPEPGPLPRLEPLNLPPVSVTRLVLWRLMNAALNRRAG